MDARNLWLLYDNRIKAVVDLAVNEQPVQLPRDMIYCRIPIIDGDGNSIGIVETAIRCGVTFIEKELRTLIACSAGMSRSPTIAAAAIALATKKLPDDCLAAVIAESPHDVSPTLWSEVKTVYNKLVGN